MTDPQRESGIPPARTRHPAERTFADEGDDHVQLALAESTRTEANLSSLLRGLSHLAAGASAARESNLALFHELDKARELLGQSSTEEKVLRQRLRLLEQTLESERQDSARHRASFIAEEDAFLAELLTDHERELEALRRRVADLLETSQLETSQLETSQLETPRRETPRRETPRRETPRQGTPRTTEPIAPVSHPPSTLASLKLRTVKIPLPPRAREEADRGAPEPSLHLSPPRPNSRPPLRQKADPSTRPLVEYSLGKSEVAEERIAPDEARTDPRRDR